VVICTWEEDEGGEGWDYDLAVYTEDGHWKQKDSIHIFASLHGVRCWKQLDLPRKVGRLGQGDLWPSFE
jgi:hypothetical protein